MNQYLFLIPFAIIYTFLFWLIIPQLSGKWMKIITAIILIPLAYFLTGYVDSYLPRFLNGIARWFTRTF